MTEQREPQSQWPCPSGFDLQQKIGGRQREVGHIRDHRHIRVCKERGHQGAHHAPGEEDAEHTVCVSMAWMVEEDSWWKMAILMSSASVCLLAVCVCEREPKAGRGMMLCAVGTTQETGGVH